MSQTKRRGRPSAAVTQSEAENSRIETEASREDAAHSGNRPPRIRMQAGGKLDVKDKDDNYVYRWFSDQPGRLDQAQAAWWEFVKQAGENIKRPSGVNTLFLMRIERKLYEEDQALKLEQTKVTLRKENELAADEYIPDGKHHALQKDDYDPLG